MLETRSNMTLCGVVAWNDDWCDIYCDEYGVLAFETYADGGCWCLTEINLGSPMPLVSSKDLVTNIQQGVYGESVGVIYGGDGKVVVLLSDNMAVERRLWDLVNNAGEPFYYSTDEEYELYDS